MIQAYVYSIKVLATGQFYLGSRGRNVTLERKPEDDLWVKYETSSKKIKAMIETLGKNAFAAEVLAKFDRHEDAYWFEQSLIKEKHKDPLCLNNHYVERDTNKRVFVGLAGIPKSEEHRRKISESNKGKHNDPDRHRRIGEAQRGKILSKEHRQKLSLANVGRKHTEETLAKMRGRKDPVGAAKRVGRKHSEETLEKMRASKRARDLTRRDRFERHP